MTPQRSRFTRPGGRSLRAPSGEATAARSHRRDRDLDALRERPSPLSPASPGIDESPALAAFPSRADQGTARILAAMGGVWSGDGLSGNAGRHCPGPVATPTVVGPAGTPSGVGVTRGWVSAIPWTSAQLVAARIGPPAGPRMPPVVRPPWRTGVGEVRG